MEVKNIIKKVAALTNNIELVNAIENNNFTPEQQEEINLLVDCVNLTNSNIAANYIKIFNIKKINNNKGTISFSSISTDLIYEVVSVKDSSGKDVNFTITPSGIITKTGEVSIRYSYFPKDVEFSSVITNYPTKISERNFVFGVISEYLYVKGVFDEALVWEERFKNEMQSLVRTQKSIVTKSRRWR